MALTPGKGVTPNFLVTDANGNTVSLKTVDDGSGNQEFVVSGAGGGGVAGSIGPAGTNGTTAQSVQGIIGGVPVPTTLAQTAATPVAGLVHTVTTGGTAVTVFAANSIVNQGIVTNPYNATESLFVDLVNAAQVAQNGGTNGTSFELQAGQSFYCPPSTVAVSVNAATSAHAFSATRF